jgi:hypothetical protein
VATRDLAVPEILPTVIGVHGARRAEPRLPELYQVAVRSQL